MASLGTPPTTMDQMVATFATAFRSRRLVYRALEDNATDRDWLYAAIQADPVNAGLATPPLFVPPHRATAAKEVASWVETALLAVLICLTDEEEERAANEGEAGKGTPIGFLVLTGSPAATAHWRGTQVVIQLAAAAQGRGYGGEAVDWALDWAFRHAGMHRVHIATAEFNERARGLYAKLGFVEEGRKREACYFDRRWWDIVQFSMLERDWKVIRGVE